MSKWLKIKEEHFINLDNVNRLWYGENTINIHYANGVILTIGTRYGDVQVKESDIDRIRKELKDYMSL
jgi:hypothetical protein